MSEEAPADMGDWFDELEELEDLVGTATARERVRQTMRVAMEASQASGTFGRVI